MKMIPTDSAKSVVLTVLSVAILVMTLGVFLTGCTDSLDGEVNENQRPLCYFANIPPEGQNFSRNPVVYWYGTDVDGLIDQYRYHIATQTDVGVLAPEDYIMAVADSDWVYIDVNPSESDPQTQQSVPLIADTANPVLGFVSQWVFLQAYDMEGAGSDITFRLFSRNDNPPTTDILDFSSSNPFVNAPERGGVVTGIRLTWQAEDEIDYPADPPPFEFQWRLYGPYTETEIDEVYTDYIRPVFQTNDGFVLEEGETLFVCDTTFVDSIPEIVCDTFEISRFSPPPSFLGSMDTILVVNDPNFISSDYNHVELASCLRDPDCLASLPSDGSPEDCPCIGEWVMDTNDTLYNVFKEEESDTTIQMKFIFWIRSRDDASVPDPTPAFDTLSVINPKFERDIAVLDFGPLFAAIGERRYLAPEYMNGVWWENRIKIWDSSIVFDASRDFITAKRAPYTSGIPLVELLQHKMLILYNDATVDATILNRKYGDRIWKAIDAGVNVWVTARCPVYGSPGSNQNPDVPFLATSGGPQYSFYFRVNRMTFSGWLNHAIGQTAPVFNTQDCMGTYSLYPDPTDDRYTGPDLFYDSARVRTLINWRLGPFDGFDPDMPWLPEVNWAEAGIGAEVMYLYRSAYSLTGSSHPLGVQQLIPGVPFDYNMDGAPVGHRFNAGLFKTVHFNFTPYTLYQDSTLDELFHVVLDFLYDPSIGEPVSSIRYEDSPMKASVSEQRMRYWQRCDERTLEDGKELSAQALRNMRR